MSGNTHWTKADEAFVLSQVKEYGGKIPSAIINGMAVVLKDRTREAIRHKAKRLQAQHGAQLRLLREKPIPPVIETTLPDERLVRVPKPEHLKPDTAINRMFPEADEPVGIEPEPSGSGKDVSDAVWFTGVALIVLGFIVAFVLLYQWLG